MAFADKLKTLPGVSHLASIQLLNAADEVVATIENKPGQAGSLAVYNHLAQIHGAITPDAATQGIEIFAEHGESKKYFKKAVDRNYFKRVLRETYRLNKHLLIDHLEKPYAFMFFYQSKERLSYQEIEEKTIQLFQKFNERQK